MKSIINYPNLRKIKSADILKIPEIVCRNDFIADISQMKSIDKAKYDQGCSNSGNIPHNHYDIALNASIATFLLQW
jgi:hypothetical protein